MSTDASSPVENSKPTPVVVFRTPSGTGGTREVVRLLPAWLISGVTHGILLGLFLFLEISTVPADTNREAAVIQTQVENEDEPSKANLDNEDIGNDPSQALNYNVSRLEDVSVPGLVNPNEAVGIKDAPEGPAMNVPPPPGFGGNTGQGGGLDSLTPGKASMIGMPGGMGGIYVPGGFGGRSGSTRERMVNEGGGNTASEAAVARGQAWLVAHQGPDGRWTLDAFH